MYQIAQYIFINFVELPAFFDNNIIIAVFMWFGGIYILGFIYGLLLT